MRGHTHARSLPHPPARSLARGRTRGRPQPGQRRGAAGSGGGGRTAGRGGALRVGGRGGLRGRGEAAEQGGGAGAGAAPRGRGWERGWRSAAHPSPPRSQPGLFPPEPAGTGWMGADGLREGGGRGGRARARRGFIYKAPPPREVRGSALFWAGGGGCAEFPLLPPPRLPPYPSRAAPRVRPRRPLPWPRAGGAARCRQRGVRARLPLPLLSLLPLI